MQIYSQNSNDNKRGNNGRKEKIPHSSTKCRLSNLKIIMLSWCDSMRERCTEAENGEENEGGREELL